MHNREKHIDIAKGLGILMVMYSHSIYNNEDTMVYISGCFIPLFFVISGYLIPVEHLCKKGYLRHKFRALLGAYLVFNLLLFSIYTLYSRNILIENILGIFYSRFCLYPIEQNSNIFMMGMLNSPTWFLTAMFVALVLYQLLMRNDKYLSYLLILYLLSVVFMKKLPILLPWSIDTAPLFAVFMYTGSLIKEKQILELKSNFFVSVMFVAYFVFCYVNGMVNVSVREYNNILLLLITGIIGSILILKFSQLLENYLCKFSVLLMMIGKDSLYVFCTHVFVFALLRNVYKTYYIYDFSILFLLLDFFAALLFGIAISGILKRLLPSVFK